MNNIQYAQKALKNADEIYIDTSSLLKPERLALFLKSNVQKDGRIYGKQIRIIETVREEMMNKLESSETMELVCGANALIRKYSGAFNIEGNRVDESLVDQAFADKDILSHLILNKTYCSQLLITNDGNLALDAISLNNQQSVSGKNIYACYVDYDGTLKRSGSSTASDENEQTIISNDCTIIQQENTVHHNEEQTKDQSANWKWFGGGVLSAASIWGAVKIGQKFELLKRIRKMIKR